MAMCRHGLKRAPVAFVPFGVAAVNFIGLSRLVAKILLATGMAHDDATKKSGLTLAGQAYAKVCLPPLHNRLHTMHSIAEHAQTHSCVQTVQRI